MKRREGLPSFYYSFFSLERVGISPREGGGGGRKGKKTPHHSEIWVGLTKEVGERGRKFFLFSFHSRKSASYFRRKHRFPRGGGGRIFRLDFFGDSLLRTAVARAPNFVASQTGIEKSEGKERGRPFIYQPRSELASRQALPVDQFLRMGVKVGGEEREKGKRDLSLRLFLHCR